MEEILQVAIFTTVACLVTLRWRSILRGALNAKWIVALALVAVTSSAWSQYPLVTLKTSLFFVAATLYGVYFGTRYTLPDQMRLIGWTCTLVVISSFLVVLFLPKYGLDHRGFFGAWQGAFLQKNVLARAMVLSVLVFHYLPLAVPKWIRWLGMGGSLCLLALSRSVSGPLVLVAIIVVVFLNQLLNKLLRLRFTFSIPILTVGSIVSAGTALVLAAKTPDILRLLGRDSTLTGRTYLWEAILRSIAKRPWLGYGFDAFWTNLRGESLAVSAQVGWVPLHAHDFFLDLTLYLGLIGLAVFVCGYILLCRRALQITRRFPGPEPVWLFAYLILMVACNFDESSLQMPFYIFWVLYAATAVNLAAYFPTRHLSSAMAPNYEF